MPCSDPVPGCHFPRLLPVPVDVTRCFLRMAHSHGQRVAVPRVIAQENLCQIVAGTANSRPQSIARLSRYRIRPALEQPRTLPGSRLQPLISLCFVGYRTERARLFEKLETEVLECSHAELRMFDQRFCIQPSWRHPQSIRPGARLRPPVAHDRKRHCNHPAINSKWFFTGPRNVPDDETDQGKEKHHQGPN